MSATLLEAPRPSAVRRPVGSPPPSIAPEPPRPRRRPGNGVLLVALAISAAIHVVILGLRFDVPAIPRASVTPVRVVDVVPGMRVYDIVGVEADVPTPSPDVVMPRQPVDVIPNVTAPPEEPARPSEAPVAAPADPDPDPASVTERIAPRAGDARLWANPDNPMRPELGPLRPELDPLGNVRARVYGSIDAYNDSVAAAAAAASKATDWTHRDANGGRWGVSPGKIHLGKVTLPLPFNFSPPAGRRDEYNDRVRTFNEIQQQAGRAEIEKTLEARIRAIRERNDAKRDSTRKSGKS